MRRAARVGRLWTLVADGLPLAQAQTSPPPHQAASPAPDSTETSTPTFVADTTWHVTVVTALEPSEAVTRPLALRIGAAIVVLPLTMLLLYNVRSR